MFYNKHYSIALANVHTITQFLGYLWQTILNTGVILITTKRDIVILSPTSSLEKDIGVIHTLTRNNSGLIDQFVTLWPLTKHLTLKERSQVKSSSMGRCSI